MPKILGQSGISLADAYDVEGSIAGVDRLEAGEVQLVHDMGPTMFSERLSGRIIRVETAALLQTVEFESSFVGLPAVAGRILQIVVFTDVASRIENVAVLVGHSVGTAQQIPIWTWATGGSQRLVQIIDDGGAAAQVNTLPPQFEALPSLLIGDDQPEVINEISLQGLTSTFGAGNVTVVALIYMAFAGRAGLSSAGIPIPGW